MDNGESLVCEQCSKKCKTKGGLKLYCKKHFIDIIDDSKIHERHYVKEAIEKASKKILEKKLDWEIMIWYNWSLNIFKRFKRKHIKSYFNEVSRCVTGRSKRSWRHWWNSYQNLNEKKVAVLQYLRWYVISNLYRKLKNSKNYQSEECQQALSLLSVCKCDVELNWNTKLVSALNRGGLCIINETVEKIFVVVEKNFHIKHKNLD